jgi:hypothetical protein
MSVIQTDFAPSISHGERVHRDPSMEDPADSDGNCLPTRGYILETQRPLFGPGKSPLPTLRDTHREHGGLGAVF